MFFGLLESPSRRYGNFTVARLHGMCFVNPRRGEKAFVNTRGGELRFKGCEVVFAMGLRGMRPMGGSRGVSSACGFPLLRQRVGDAR